MYFIVPFVFIQQISKRNQLSLTASWHIFPSSIFAVHFTLTVSDFSFFIVLCLPVSFAPYKSCPCLRHPYENWKNPISSIATIACQRPAKIRGSNIRSALECSLRGPDILATTNLKHGELNQVSLDYSYSRTSCFPGN